MNVLNLNNNKFDLPFAGNLGKDGEQGLIRDLNNLKNTYILIRKEGPIIQEFESVWNYISDNFEKEGEISFYYIYKTSDI